MSTFRVDDKVSDYIVRSCTPPDEVVAGLVRRTAEVGELYEMMTPVEEAALLTLIARITGATTVVEVGTFTGLSALSFARGMPADGRVITCDVTQEWLEIAREYWQRAGVEDKIEFRLGPARKTLATLAETVRADIVFVDADKASYPHYYAGAVPLLRSGGLLILDNVLLKGTVVDPSNAGGELQQYVAEIMDSVNEQLAADDRFDTVMLSIGDGEHHAQEMRPR